ncbi:discoidin domain-containing protein [Catenuloplanes atrovinosus]|uniref:F5/8 type C domain-containing protein n=1 Tax=Catenuloplanes atrovinosus TaxID=137266 RepID=A0AAE3YIT9_9ACTN|nr:discoidin domain-containing protein [Catenuloplanes atrovinosus]MDR7274280.1 hypothetical protein [Catenuloplanes atrovinosus]
MQRAVALSGLPPYVGPAADPADGPVPPAAPQPAPVRQPPPTPPRQTPPRQAPPAPAGQMPPAPPHQASPAPAGQTPPAPGAQTPPAPGAQTPPAPAGQTPPTPRRQRSPEQAAAGQAPDEAAGRPGPDRAPVVPVQAAESQRATAQNHPPTFAAAGGASAAGAPVSGGPTFAAPGSVPLYSDLEEEDATRSLPNAVPPAPPARRTGERFRPWLVPLVLVGVIAVAAAVLGSRVPGDDASTAPQATLVPETGTVITLGPPSPATTAVTPSGSPSPSVSPSSTGSPAPSASGGASAAAPVAPAPATSGAPKASPPAAGKVNSGGANLALGRPAVASSLEDDRWPAGAAVDGDMSSRWSSGFADPQWIQVDLGQTWAVTTVDIFWEHAYATAYRVDLSTDGLAWKTVYTTSSGTGGEAIVQAGGAAARYVRVWGTARNGQYGYSILELRVF